MVHLTAQGPQTDQGIDQAFRTGVQTYARRRERRAEEQRYQGELARAAEEEQADIEATLFRLQEIEDEEQRSSERKEFFRRIGVMGPDPEELWVGEPGVDPGIAARFERVRALAERLTNPKSRARFLLEERQRATKQAQDRAGQSVADAIQDRLASGSYTLHGQTEPKPEILSILEGYLKSLDQGADPLKVQEMDAKVLESIVAENEELMKREAGLAILEQERSKARESGNRVLMGHLATAEALYEAGLLDPDDLDDRLYKLKTGKDTARAARADRIGLRERAATLYQKATLSDVAPTEEQLQPFLAVLEGPQQAAGPAPEALPQERPGVFVAPGAGGLDVPRGTDESLAPAPTLDPDRLAAAQASVAGGPQEVQPAGVARKAPKAPKAPKAKKGQDAAWSELEPARQVEISDAFIALLKRPGATAAKFRALAKKLGVDGDSIPPELLAEWRKAALRSKKPLDRGRQ